MITIPAVILVGEEFIHEVHTCIKASATYLDFDRVIITDKETDASAVSHLCELYVVRTFWTDCVLI